VKSSVRPILARLFEQSSASSWLKPIEGMRGFAAFLVFFVHFDALLGTYVLRGSMSSRVSRLAGAFGNTGVDMFFVISGFLIYGIIIRRSPGYWDFMRRRIVRLYPVFLFVFAIYLVLSRLSPVDSKIPAGAHLAIPYVVANLLMLPGMIRITPMITVAWSLSYELFFYASLPVVVYGLGMKRWRPAMRALLFAGLVIVYYMICAAGYAHHPRLIMFAAGIFLYETMNNSSLAKRLPLQLDYVAILAVCAALALTGVRILSEGQATKMLVEVPTGSLALLFFSFFFMALCALCHDGLLMKFFSLAGVRWFGNISYSYYLTHGLTLKGLQLVLRVVHFPGQLGAISYLILEGGCFAVTVLMAAAVYLTIERPFSLAKRRAAEGLRAQSVQVARAV
jgi:exopolysaccharide production protein ExoZ